MRKTKIHIIMAALAVAMPLTSCVYDTYDNNDSTETGPAQLQLTIVMPLADAGEGREYGTGWENYIDFAGDDWRLYIFNRSQPFEVIGEVTSGDLLSVTANADSTEYTMVANFPDGFFEFAEIGNTRVGYCLLANWGHYETPTLGKTLLWSMVDQLFANYDQMSPYGDYLGGFENFSEDYAKFDAMVDGNGTAIMPSKDVRIPIYGARVPNTNIGINPTPGVIYKPGYDVFSFRAVAKVEVIMESTNVEIEELKLVGYNKQGNSGIPAGNITTQNGNVYFQPSYLFGYYEYNNTKPYLSNRYYDINEWIEYDDNIKYRSNDALSTENVMNFAKVQDGSVNNGVIQYETWRAYVPEYDNTLNAGLSREPNVVQGETNYNGREYYYNNYDDYCYISMKLRGVDEEYIIYFADYDDDGTTNAYDDGGDTGKRLDILRNHIYRFYVQQSNGNLSVSVDKWENEYDNSYEFGRN